MRFWKKKIKTEKYGNISLFKNLFFQKWVVHFSWISFDGFVGLNVFSLRETGIFFFLFNNSKAIIEFPINYKLFQNAIRNANSIRFDIFKIISIAQNLLYKSHLKLFFIKIKKLNIDLTFYFFIIVFGCKNFKTEQKFFGSAFSAYKIDHYINFLLFRITFTAKTKIFIKSIYQMESL